MSLKNAAVKKNVLWDLNAMMDTVVPAEVQTYVYVKLFLHYFLKSLKLMSKLH